MKMSDIVLQLSKILSDKRLEHSLGVVESSSKLAMLYGEDLKKIQIAALLHDCAKCFDNDQMQYYINKFNIPLDCIEKKEIELAHGRIGSYVAQDKFKVTDAEILSAITYHTTGKKNMTKIEKIIYLADFIEPNRNYKGVDELRDIAYGGNLDKALLLSFDNTIKYVISINKLLHPRTVQARNFLLEQFNEA